MKNQLIRYGVLACLLTATGAGMRAAEPLLSVKNAVAHTFGDATANATRLLKAERCAADPLVWLVFAEDVHRQSDLIKVRVERAPGQSAYKATSAGAGQLLHRVPPLRIDWSRVRVSPLEARRTAERGALLAKSTFQQVEYQLATQPTTNAPEWALTLYDAGGKDVGFVVVSAENGAVIHQDFGPADLPTGLPPRGPDEGELGEEAAKSIKRGVRKAWDWAERARRETRGFFRELFRELFR